MSAVARSFSPGLRADSPEPASRQGRRNTFGVPGEEVQLLDDDGTMSVKFEACLAYIFGKYCTPRPKSSPSSWLASPSSRKRSPSFLSTSWLPDNAYFTPEALDNWARDTNGMALSEEMKTEIVESIDVNDDGNLTFTGLLQIYQLQTAVDEEETWRDLASHGFDRNLELVSTRREEAETPPPALEEQDKRETTS